MPRDPVQWRAMTADEQTMATAVGFARVLPATFDKRIVGELAACARDDVPRITERLALVLRRLVHKYRRQLRDDVVALAGERPAEAWDAEANADHVASLAPPAPIASTRAHDSTPQLSLL